MRVSYPYGRSEDSDTCLSITVIRNNYKNENIASQVEGVITANVYLENFFNTGVHTYTVGDHAGEQDHAVRPVLPAQLAAGVDAEAGSSAR